MLHCFQDVITSLAHVTAWQCLTLNSLQMDEDKIFGMSKVRVPRLPYIALIAWWSDQFNRYHTTSVWQMDIQTERWTQMYQYCIYCILYSCVMLRLNKNTCKATNFATWIFSWRNLITWCHYIFTVSCSSWWEQRQHMLVQQKQVAFKILSSSISNLQHTRA